MKNFKFLAVAALLAVATSASAQFTNSTSRSSSSSVNTDGWSTIWVEWNPSTFKYDVKGADNESFTGLSLGYSQAFSVTKSIPLFAEVGLGVQYSFKTHDLGEEYDLDEDDYEYMDPKQKFSLISAKVPVNLIYAFQIPNSSISILPFVGVNLRYNISGKMKTQWNLSDDMIDYLEDYYGKDWEEYSGLEDTDANLFDKKDMGSSDATWKRFQIGYQVGLKARINNSLLLGISYGSDFSEIYKKAKISTTSVTIGYTF